MTNQLTITLVVVLLGVLAIVMGAGTIWLIHDGLSDPALIAVPAGLAGTALGALGSLLASTHVNPVQVVAAPAQADPVQQ